LASSQRSATMLV